MTPILAILAIERTGTNFLCSLLESHPEVMARYELFHPEEAYSIGPDLAAFGDYVGESFDGRRDPRLREFLRCQPSRLIEFYRSRNPHAGKKLVTLKVFPDHLESTRLDEAIVGSTACIKILVKRRVLDSYISLAKAMKVQKWNVVDTTEMTVRLDAAHFVSWYAARKRWYDWCRDHAAASGQPAPEFDYEELVDGDHVGNLNRFLERAGALQFVRPADESMDFSRCFTRQDRGGRPTDSVENLDRFLADVDGHENVGDVRGYF